MTIRELINNLETMEKRYGNKSVVFKPYNSHYIENITEVNKQDCYIGDEEVSSLVIVIESSRQIGSFE